MTRILKAWGAGCAGQLLLNLVLTVVIGGAFLGVIVVAALLPLPAEAEAYRLLLMGAGLVLVLAVVMGGVGTWAVWTLVNRKRQLDAAFLPLGLRGQMYLTNGRHYAGTVEGRQVDAWFYRGPALDFYVSAAIHTRLNAATSDRVAAAVTRALPRQPLTLTDPNGGQIQVVAHDEAWAQAWLALPPVAAAVGRLVTSQPEGGPFELRQLLLEPGAVCLKLYRTRVSQLAAGPAQAWLADLLTVAQAAETLPPPRELLSASTLEQNARTRRQVFFGPALALSCGLVAALGVCITTIMALALWAEGQ